MSKGAQLLTKAERSLAAAERLLADGDPDFAVSRSYYGFFYVAEALLHSEGLEFLRHGQVLAQDGRHFAKTGRLDPRFHQLFSRAFSARQIADYAAGYDQQEDSATLADQGAVVFLEKPYSPHDLTAKVGLLLDTARR